MDKKHKPAGGKWADVIEAVEPPDGGYDPYAVPPEWEEMAELDGEALPIRGLFDQLEIEDANRIIVTMKGGGTFRPFKDIAPNNYYRAPGK